MRLSYFGIFLFAIPLSVSVLSGCTITVNGHTARLPVSVVSVRSAIIDVTSSGRKVISMSQSHAERTEEKTISASDLHSIRVRGDFGGIDVEPSASDREAHIRIVKTVGGQDFKVAELEQLAERVHLQTETRDGILEISAVTPKDFPKKASVGVSFTVSAPRRLNLDLDTANGGVQVKETGHQVRAKSEFGSVTVVGAGGDVDARSSNGAVIVEQASGARKVIAHSDFGSVTVRQVGGEIDVVTGNGAITIEETPNAPRILAKSDFGSVTLKNVGGNIEARSENGSVAVESATIAEQLTLVSHFGGVRGMGIRASGTALKAHLMTENGPVHFAGDASELTLKSQFGGVEAALSDRLKLQSGEVQTENGAISLRLPPGFAAHLDAHTENGSIRTEGFSVTNRAKDGMSQNVSESLNGGNAPLRVRSDFGSITIHL